MIHRERIVIVVFVAAILLTLSLATPLLSATRNTAWQVAISTVGNIAGLDPLNKAEQLDNQLAELTSENARLKGELADYKILREQLAEPDFDSLRKIPAIMLSQPIDIWQTEKRISRGLDDGVTIGAPVVAYGSTLVGIVTETSKKQSVVRLLNHPDISLPVRVVIDDENEADGLATGQNYTGLKISTILREQDIKEGQRVISATNELVPAGLLIGEISQITSDESSAYYEGNVNKPASRNSLRAVTVLAQP